MNRAELALLTRARDRVASVWVQGVYQAHRQNGELLRFSELPVNCWCAAGAVWAEYRQLPDKEGVTVVVVFEGLAKRLPDHRDHNHEGKLVDFNDYPDRTQAEVMDLFDRAIEEESC